jgi:hypothetical protein
LKDELETLCEVYEVALDGKAPLDVIFELEKDIEDLCRLNRLLKYARF